MTDGPILSPTSPAIPATQMPPLESWPHPKADDPSAGSQDPQYKASVARKKVAWAISKLISAKIIAWASLPCVLAAWDSFTAWLQAHGVTIIIDQKVFTAALPGIIFGVFVLGHDWAKVKYPNITWL